MEHIRLFVKCSFWAGTQSPPLRGRRRGTRQRGYTPPGADAPTLPVKAGLSHKAPKRPPPPFGHLPQQSWWRVKSWSFPCFQSSRSTSLLGELSEGLRGTLPDAIALPVKGRDGYQPQKAVPQSKQVLQPSLAARFAEPQDGQSSLSLTSVKIDPVTALGRKVVQPFSPMAQACS
jgi:hypothetical protein